MSHNRHTPKSATTEKPAEKTGAYHPHVDLSETMVERAVERIQIRHPERNTAGRHIENALAIAGTAQVALYGTLEALSRSGYMLGTCKPSTGVPWVTLAFFFGAVLPKTVGRATAGKIWGVLLKRAAP